MRKNSHFYSFNKLVQEHYIVSAAQATTPTSHTEGDSLKSNKPWL